MLATIHSAPNAVRHVPAFRFPHRLQQRGKHNQTTQLGSTYLEDIVILSAGGLSQLLRHGEDVSHLVIGQIR